MAESLDFTRSVNVNIKIVEDKINGTNKKSSTN